MQVAKVYSIYPLYLSILFYKVGDNAVIGAGSVVTRDIPANVLACGVPCKVVKELNGASNEESK